MRKRELPQAEEVSAWIQEYWAATPFQVLKRAATAVRAGVQIDKADRILTAVWLEAISKLLQSKLNRMGDAQRRALIVDYLSYRKKMTLRAAAVVMAGPHRPAAVLKAAGRLRRGRWKTSRRK